MTPMRTALSLFALVVPFAFISQRPAILAHAQPLSETDRTAITAVLARQQADWNRGDVTAFMQGYWKSSELTFAGSKGFTHGWEAVLARYQRDYPDKAAMGQLDFSNLEIRSLGADAALVLGNWRLARASGELGGIFTLVFQRFPDGWRIVHDHTTLTIDTKH